VRWLLNTVAKNHRGNKMKKPILSPITASPAETSRMASNLGPRSPRRYARMKYRIKK